MTDAGGLEDDDLTTNAPAAGARGGGLPPAPAHQEPVKAGDPATDTPEMDDDGWTPFGGVPGPSPELEAQWGPRVPTAAAASAVDAAADPDAGVDPFAHLAVLVPEVVPSTRRRVPVIAAIAAAVVLVAAGVSAALLLPGDDDDKTETAVAGAASDESDDDEAKASGSRFGALGGLGARGVGANATTTTTDPRTTTTTSTARPRSSSSGSSGTGSTSGSGSTRPTPTDPSEPPSAEAKSRLQEAVPAAQAFVDAFIARDCERIWSLMSADSQKFIDAFGQEEGKSGKDSFCESLKNEAEMPSAIEVIPPARAIGGDRAEVDLKAEVDGEVEVDPVVLVLEGGRWLIDLLGGEEMDDEDYEEYDDTGGAATHGQRDVMNGLTAEMTLYTDYGRFVDDTGELAQVEPSLTWRRGIANGNTAAGAGEVYVALANNGQVVCISSRDADGTLQMVKDVETADSSETTFASGTIPSTCDDKPLADTWS